MSERPSLSGFLSERVRQRLVTQVRGVFNDTSRGEAPVPPSDDALFAPDTPIRMVHADLVGMMVGGFRGLLLQVLHPHALQGVLDHSNYRTDAHGRLRRTARFIATTTFGHRDDALKAIARVNAIHARVSGTLPDGTPYSASDPRTLAFVHVAEALSFLAGYMAYVRPDMPLAEQDEYFRQFAVIARLLHADPVPVSRAEAEALLAEMRADLSGSPAAREVARFVLETRPEGVPPGVQRLIGVAATELLPAFARVELGLKPPSLSALPARAAMRGAGRTLRWAFRQN